MTDLRVGLIGAGWNGSNHIAPALTRISGVKIEAVCDTDLTKATELAGRFRIARAYADAPAMFADASLDAVAITVGPAAHAELAISAMEAGLHVFTEKPPALTAADAQRVLQTSCDTGLVCMTGFRKRFAPAYQRAKSITESAAFGRPTTLSVVAAAGRFENEPGRPASWFLLDYGIHVVDIARFLFGEVSAAIAMSGDRTSYVALLQFSTGARGSLTLTCGRPWSLASERIEATSAEGQFVVVTDGGRVRHSLGDGVVQWAQGGMAASRADSLVDLGFVGELEEFAVAIRDGREPESSIANACRTMAILDSIAQQAHSDN